MNAVERRTEWRLSELLRGAARVSAPCDRAVSGLCSDSRAAVQGDLFFARRGGRTSGERYVADALARGVAAVVREGEADARVLPEGVPVLSVPDVDACLGLAAHRFYGAPSETLRVIGITGTNGKTSVAQFLAGALSRPEVGGAAAPRCGVIGTLGHGIHGALRPGTHTTPDALTTHALLAEMRAAGARHTVMEVSSHALDQGRVAGVRFDTAVFTNLSRDHLDYHADMDAYGAAKRRLFMRPELRRAVLNRDDAFGAGLAAALPGRVDRITYGMTASGGAPGPGGDRHVAGQLRATTPAGLELSVASPWGSGQVAAPLLGPFNAGNLLAALAILLVLEVPFTHALAALNRTLPVPGRMQPFGGPPGRPLVVVDYSHTPDALRSALIALRAHCRGRLWCVFGCGGDRDRGKRALMGAIAAERADAVVVTDDNPRHEDGQRIVADILAGMPGGAVVTVERDRRAAIRHAVHAAAPGDAVLVAGKGHEPYQEVAGVRRAFSDAEVVAAALEEQLP